MEQHFLLVTKRQQSKIHTLRETLLSFKEVLLPLLLKVSSGINSNLSLLGKNPLNLKNDTFNSNDAIRGATIAYSGDMMIYHQNCSFSFNSGGAFSSKPEKLRLRIYQVDEMFTYLEENSFSIGTILQTEHVRVPKKSTHTSYRF